MVLGFILAAIGGYLLGSIPFGLVLTRAAGLGDIRQVGSGNIGATNVLRTGRKDIALATLLLDAGKAAIALLLARAIWGAVFGDQPGDIEAGFIAGGAAFLGHCFPIWLGFKGGKGVATFFGLLLAGLFPIGALAAITWLAMAVMFRISSLAALVAAAIAPLAALIGGEDVAAVLFCAGLAALIYWRHAPNITRLLNGTEPRIGAKKAEAEAAPAEAAAPAPEAVAPPPAPAPEPQTEPRTEP